MSINYTFESPILNFDGRWLSIKLGSAILKFTNIGDFSIENNKLSFYGDGNQTILKIQSYSRYVVNERTISINPIMTAATSPTITNFLIKSASLILCASSAISSI